MKDSKFSRQERWHLVYYALAAFDLLTVSLSLLLFYNVMNIYEESVAVNAHWAHRVGWYSDLNHLLVLVNSPGNDIFESNNVEQEQSSFDQYYRDFQELFARVKEDNTRLAELAIRAELDRHLQDVATAVVALRAEAMTVFHLMSQGRRNEAGRHMAIMDQKFALGAGFLTKLSQRVRRQQEHHLQKEVAAASRLKNFEYLIGFGIVFMVVSLTFYGNIMSRRIRSNRQELIQAKEAAEAAEIEHRAVVESSADGILTLDTRGIIEAFNPACEKLFGYEKEEVVGKNVSCLLGAPHAADLLKSYLETGVLGICREVQARRRDGSLFPIFLSLSQMIVHDETRHVGILHDISEQKKAEQDLIQAKEEAEAANEAKSEFLANMSHEIRTPMNGVIGMTELLLDTELTEEQREYAETVCNSADALLAVINDILDFSKVEAGKLDFEYIDFDLQAMLDEVAALLAFKAEDKALNFTCFLHPDVDTSVNGDPGRLRQIIINLTNNAIKFTKQGEVAIRGELQHESETEICIRFSVTDTGIGIAKEARSKLFQSFSQVDASTTRRFGGTGLGLAISKQLAEMMGGEIGVESKEGEGSTFWFTALLKKQPEENRERPHCEIDIAGRRILVVDDNKTNREVLRLQLQARECIIEEAENGVAALALLRLHAENNHPFDIAIIDMQMPETDGETLGIAIKKEPAINETILVMLTSMGERGDAKRMCEIGFQAYLTKPVKWSQLCDCLSRVLDQKGKHEAKVRFVTHHTLTETRKMKAKVLIVEDNIVNQKVAAKMLKKMGCRVDRVANGKEAVEAVVAVPYDLVLMDCQMPEMDGFEATAEIRRAESEERGARIPIIAMTANAMKGDREKCLAAGMDDYLTKPVEIEKLQEALVRWTTENNESKKITIVQAAIKEEITK